MVLMAVVVTCFVTHQVIVREMSRAIVAIKNSIVIVYKYFKYEKNLYIILRKIVIKIHTKSSMKSCKF